MGKIKTLDEILKIVNDLKNEGKTIVTTNGCFDILHVGHVRYLQEAKKLGNILIIGVNSDISTRKIKGEGRPINPENERMEVLAALECVDYVLLFDESEPSSWLGKVKPHIHTKGSDWTMDQIIEKDTVENAGGKIVLLKKIDTRSTTDIIKMLKNKERR